MQVGGIIIGVGAAIRPFDPTERLCGPTRLVQAFGDLDYVDEVRPGCLMGGDKGVHIPLDVGDVPQAAVLSASRPIRVPEVAAGFGGR